MSYQIGSLKLVDVESWHWRVGRYRVIYEIDDEQQMVIVLGIRPRLLVR
jgi:mRNA-degrading endonuclease RelE of RelBE toxin-antitoxin system